MAKSNHSSTPCCAKNCSQIVSNIEPKKKARGACIARSGRPSVCGCAHIHLFMWHGVSRPKGPETPDNVKFLRKEKKQATACKHSGESTPFTMLYLMNNECTQRTPEAGAYQHLHVRYLYNIHPEWKTYLLKSPKCLVYIFFPPPILDNVVSWSARCAR